MQEIAVLLFCRLQWVKVLLVAGEDNFDWWGSRTLFLHHWPQHDHWLTDFAKTVLHFLDRGVKTGC